MCNCLSRACSPEEFVDSLPIPSRAERDAKPCVSKPEGYKTGVMTTMSIRGVPALEHPGLSLFALAALEPGDTEPGRPRIITNRHIRDANRLIEDGEPAAQVARDFGMSRATFYRRARARGLMPDQSGEETAINGCA